MIQKDTTTRIAVISGLVLVLALTRIIPHLPNFTPINAVCLFGGSMFRNRLLAFAVPIAVMLLSDLIIGFHNNMIAVYGAFILVIFAGYLIRNKINITTVISTSIISSLTFFLVTNFSTWLGDPRYTQNLAGLFTDYTESLPFLRNQVLGDLFYSGAIFGLFALATKKFPILMVRK